MSSNLPKACPLCGAPHEKHSLTAPAVYGGGGEHEVWHCSACDVRFLHPGLSEEDEAVFYAKEFEKFMSVRSAADAGWEGADAHRAANESERVRRTGFLADVLQGPPGKLLEVGCSSGFMLSEFSAKGWDVTGVEPSGTFSEFVESLGIPCYGSLDDVPEAAGPFDLILHYYVLEHIKDAETFIRTQYDLLKPGGKIVLEVPHADDALAALYDIDAYHDFIWVVSHRWYFSRPSMRTLLSRISPEVDVVLDQRYDLSNHMVWALDRKPGGKGRFTEVFKPELEEAYKAALVQAGYGDTLIATIRKPN